MTTVYGPFQTLCDGKLGFVTEWTLPEDVAASPGSCRIPEFDTYKQDICLLHTLHLEVHTEHLYHILGLVPDLGGPRG